METKNELYMLTTFFSYTFASVVCLPTWENYILIILLHYPHFAEQYQSKNRF